MYTGIERRKEKRLKCDWVIWFVNDLNQSPCHGVIHDLSSEAVSFLCCATKEFPLEKQELIAYFYIPDSKLQGSLRKITRVGQIGRITTLDKFLRRVELKFYEPLPFVPNELEAVNMIVDYNKK